MKTYNSTTLNENENASWLHLEEVKLSYKNNALASQRPIGESYAQSIGYKNDG